MFKPVHTALFCAFFFLTGCSGGGPQSGAILNAPNAQKIDGTGDEPFVLVDMGRSFAERISATYPEFVSHMPRSAPEPFVIGVSDSLDISIVSNNEEGFIDFSQSAIAPLSTTRLPRQEVATDGTVAVPQLGRVRAAGRSVQEFESSLTKRLSQVLINPTAIVQLVDRQSTLVSVIGRVSARGSYPINLSTRRLLDVIGLAGGPTTDTEGLIVSLSRNGVTHRAALADLYKNKSLNIFVRGGDLIAIEPAVTRIQVLGATRGNTVVEFDTPGVTLIDVLSRAGGLSAPRAARKGVFVFREAPKRQLATLGADLKAFSGFETVPTVFRIDLTDPNALFTAKRFRMMDGDIFYVADSLSQQISDFFGSASKLAPLPADYIRDETITRR